MKVRASSSTLRLLMTGCLLIFYDMSEGTVDCLEENML